MNFVFLSPHYPPYVAHFCQALRRAGVNVLGLGETPYAELGPELQHALTDYYRVDNMHRYDELMRACGCFIHRHGRLDRFESLNEYWLDSEAHIRTDFNIPGVKTDSIKDIKLKSHMKQIFRKIGLRVARGALADTLEDARKLARELGYPMVAKPDSGIGASNTYRLESDAELEHLFANKPPFPFIFEEFINGTIVTFDGLANSRAEVLLFSSHEYSHSALDILAHELNHYYFSHREIPADLEAAGRAIVKAFDARERFFHLEFFRPAEGGALVALEVNMRPPGGSLVDMINFANDVDIYDGWAELVRHDRCSLITTRKYHCAYVGRRANRAYVHSHQALLDRLGPCLVDHHAIDALSAPVMCEYGYIIRTPELGHMHELAALIHQEAA